MLNLLCRAAVLLGLFTVLTGVVYPLAVTGVAQVCFPHRANGSAIGENGIAVGSELIGQQLADPRYFHGRPSASTPLPYCALPSGASNLGPLSPVLREQVTARVVDLRAASPNATGPVPVDLVTASGSGLDPHISPTAASYQVDRVARAGGLSSGVVRRLVEEYTEGRQLGFIGEPRVNVLKLNLALDSMR